MAVTLGSGGSGGVLTPTLFIGATAGSFFARLFSLDQSVFSALGLVAVLAGATNTPIASTILAMELYGSAVAPFAGIACAVSYVVTGHRSLYPGQLILRPKARAFVIKTDEKGRKEIVGRFEGVSFTRIVKFFVLHLKNRFKIDE
jgi:H+/Cl- antiporter ClcA